jgi:hypothetical protein
VSEPETAVNRSAVTVGEEAGKLLLEYLFLNSNPSFLLSFSPKIAQQLEDLQI